VVAGCGGGGGGGVSRSFFADVVECCRFTCWCLWCGSGAARERSGGGGGCNRTRAVADITVIGTIQR